MRATFRPLSLSDKAGIETVLGSRSSRPLVGVYWGLDSIENEIKASSSLGYFLEGLQAFVLFKSLGSVLEILLIFSKKGSSRGGEILLKNLLDSHRHIDEVWLEVHEDNRSAIEFYERQGFLKVGVRGQYYPDGKSAVNYSLKIVK